MDLKRFAVSEGDLGRFFLDFERIFLVPSTDTLGAMNPLVAMDPLSIMDPLGAMISLSAMDQFSWYKGLIGISKEYLIFVQNIRRFSLQLYLFPEKSTKSA